MSRALLDHVVASSLKVRPLIKPGATVNVHQKIKEGEKERIQIFKGLVIRINSGHKADKTFTVRKVVEGVGVEKIFPIHSSMIEKIEVVKQGKVRRAKLFYMRDLEGKSTRLRETALGMAEEPSEPVITPEKAEEELAKTEAAEEVAQEEVKEEAPAEAEAEAPAEEK